MREWLSAAFNTPRVFHARISTVALHTTEMTEIASG
jgi:hypothetical protein